MTHRIYEMSENAKANGMTWDDAIYQNEIVTVKEFDTYEEAVKEYENENYDADLYGVE